MAILQKSLVYQGLVSQSNDGYKILKLNNESWKILQHKRKVKIALNNEQNNNSQDLDNPRKLETEILLSRLKKLRKKLADEENIAPYVIFGDSTLKVMAQLQPISLESLSKISGVTEYKLNKYGNYFLREIIAFNHEQPVITPLPSHTHMKTLQFYQQGLTVSEIAKKRGLTESTIISHFCELIELNQPVNVNEFVNPEKQKNISEALNKIGDKFLKPIRDYLGSEYSYDEIKLVKAKLASYKIK